MDFDKKIRDRRAPQGARGLKSFPEPFSVGLLRRAPQGARGLKLFVLLRR